MNESIGLTAKDIARFWRSVDKSGGDDACWLWTAARNCGYGDFWARPRVKTHRAHRIAYLLTFGPIDDRVMVCHRCDVRLCVNPAHLWLGDALANNRDRDAKGRAVHARGSGHGNALLTEAAVVEIFESIRAGETQIALAERFNVDPTTIGLVCRRKTWRHVKAPWELEETK